MKRDYIKGKTTEDKFKSINRIFQYIFPRLGRRVVCAIPPIPIFIECGKADENGLLCRRLIPISGIISKVCMMVERSGNADAVFALVLSNNLGSNTFRFSTKKIYHIEEVNYTIEAGTLLTLYTDTPEVFSNIYLSALLNVQLKDVNREILLEEAKNAEEIAQEVGEISE